MPNIHREMVEFACEGLIYQAADGEIKVWNRAAEKIFGVSAHVAVGETSASRNWKLIKEDGTLCPPEEHPSMITLASGKPLFSQVRGIKKDGQPTTWISINTQPVFKPGHDKPEAVVISFSDISERKSAEAELEASKQKLETLSKQTDQLAMAAVDLLSIEDMQVLFSRISQAIVDFSDYKRVLISLFKDEHPYREIIGHGGLEEELVDRLRHIEMPAHWYDGIFQSGIKLGQLTYYIPHTMKDLLKPDATVFGDGPEPASSDAWHPEDNLFVRMNNEKGEFIGVISVDQSKSGLRPTDEIVRPLEIFASLISQIIALRTEQKRRKALELQLMQTQKLDALGTLASGIAHDFNNILAAIMGYSELAQESLEKTHPARKDLAEITKAAGKAKHLILQILTFGRRSESELRPLSINQAACDARNMLERTLPKMIQLEFDLQKDLHAVKADPHQIEQVLLNLVTNAADASGESGKITITTRNVSHDSQRCEVCRETYSGDYVMLSVKDNGTGMSPDLKARIFDPFFTTKDVGKGTGLGLSTVFGIVTTHNGHINCHSEEGSGSEFVIYLPATEKVEEKAPKSSGTQKRPSADNETILMVDDESVVRDIAGKILARSGYKTLAAESGEKALEIYQKRQNDIDLVLLDLGMPGMGGKACLKQLIDLNPKVKVLIASGYIQYEGDEKLKELGAIGMVAKPYRLDELLVRVREVLDA
jgi:PAS domain S-box-containing protein